MFLITTLLSIEKTPVCVFYHPSSSLQWSLLRIIPEMDEMPVVLTNFSVRIICLHRIPREATNILAVCGRPSSHLFNVGPF